MYKKYNAFKTTRPYSSDVTNSAGHFSHQLYTQDYGQVNDMSNC